MQQCIAYADVCELWGEYHEPECRTQRAKGLHACRWAQSS